jgi:hypothetical protein
MLAANAAEVASRPVPVECVAVQLPVALLNAWWARLSPEVKAEHFRRELVEGAGL